jgi:hypothetical protein
VGTACRWNAAVALPNTAQQFSPMVLLNCAIDATTVYSTYRKPFDVIFTRAKNEEWRTRGDAELFSRNW